MIASIIALLVQYRRRSLANIFRADSASEHRTFAWDLDGSSLHEMRWPAEQLQLSHNVLPKIRYEIACVIYVTERGNLRFATRAIVTAKRKLCYLLETESGYFAFLVSIVVTRGNF